MPIPLVCIVSSIVNAVSHLEALSDIFIHDTSRSEAYSMGQERYIELR